jgi:hypothetical protein
MNSKPKSTQNDIIRIDLHFPRNHGDRLPCEVKEDIRLAQLRGFWSAKYSNVEGEIHPYWDKSGKVDHRTRGNIFEII